MGFVGEMMMWGKKFQLNLTGNCEFAFRKDNPITRTSESDKRERYCKDIVDGGEKKRRKSFF